MLDDRPRLSQPDGVVRRYAVSMVRKLKTAIRYVLIAYVAYGIIYQFPC